MGGTIGSVSGGSSSGRSKDVSKKEGGRDVDRKDKKDESRAAEEARQAAEAARRAEAARKAEEAARLRDRFVTRPAGTRGLVVLDGGATGQPQAPAREQNTFRVSAFGVPQAQSVSASPSAVDTQAKAYVEEQFQQKLGRPAGNADEILAQARASGAQTLEDIQKYVDGMIDGSPEKAALNHINAEFESKLGRSLSVAEQAQWLRESGLSPTAPDFRQQVSARINSSEEYRQKHPNAGPAMSAEDAFILQFNHERWNPTGPNKSTNCGPASLAMAMNYTGRMPPGLTKEQQVDHARALMRPDLAGTDAITYVKDANGKDVPLLNRDGELTGGTMEQDGIRAAGGNPQMQSGWDALDKALESGPVLGNGYLGPAWREQFPQRVGSGDIGHVNAILGKTPEGKYIVADPMHTGGPVEMTREQLSVFFPDSNGVPTFAATGFGNNASAPAPGGSAPGATPPAPAAPTGPTASGAPAEGLRFDGGRQYNAQVEQLQRELVKLGYLQQREMDTGPGFYGNRTRAAVERLQRDYGVPGDGTSYDAATRAALERAIAGERPAAPTGPTAPVTPGTGGTAPQYTFNARAFPGFYDASNDGDRIYNIAKMAKDAPKMWAEYGETFKKVGQELGVDPQALAAYCCFESYRGDWGTFNPNASASHGRMVAAGIAQTQAQDWAGREVPGLPGVRFPGDVAGTAAMLKANPEYGIRCLATIMKEKYDNNGQDLARAFPLTAYPSWGDPSIRRGAYGDQATYVSRAFVLYNAFREAEGLPRV
jgi:hypothetical protein